MQSNKLFDNIITKIFFLFLPFTYALTINLKFPLKISELALFAIIITLFAAKKIPSIFSHNAPLKIFLVFIGFTFLSMFINLFWKYPYPLTEYESRFGYGFDSVMKFFYLLLSFLAFFVCSNSFFFNRDRYIRFFLWGGFIASCYGWYLFLSGLLRLPEFLLPGIDEPQYINIPFGVFIRSGTFKEGNYMGLFLLFCAILSFYSNRRMVGYYFIASLLPTFSSMAFICAALLLICIYFKRNFTKRKMVNLFVIVGIMIAVFLSMLPNEDFRYLILSKIDVGNTEMTTHGDFSRLDRTNSLIVAVKMGADNPVFGVGISNFARHYTKYNDDLRFYRPDLKGIANNIYAEIFSETGVPGLILFLLLLYHLYKKAKLDESGILKYGLLAILIYFVAFPTFSMLYIWAFFGLINSQTDSIQSL